MYMGEEAERLNIAWLNLTYGRGGKKGRYLCYPNFKWVASGSVLFIVTSCHPH